MKNNILHYSLAIFELTLIIFYMIGDIFIPSIMILGTGIIFIVIRKEKMSFRGLGQRGTLKTVLHLLVLAALWSLVDFGLVIPVLNHLTHTKQDMVIFGDLKGNVKLLVLLLIAGWVIGALIEEFAYRGIVQNRIIRLFHNEKFGICVAVILSSVAFGLVHMEQGIVGVVTIMADAIFFSLLKYHYKSIWACVLAHGFMNSIGIITFFFTGPIYGLW